VSRGPPARLSRRKASRATRPLVIVFCEGKNTEPDYILAFAKDCGVKVHIESVVGTPATLVDAAAVLRKSKLRKTNDSYGRSDPIWVVFDCDEHPNLGQAFDKARGNGIEVAFSNPCIEIWAFLHFEDHDKPLHRHEMQKELERVMPSFKANKSKRFDFSLMRPGYNAADERAERMRQRRRDQGDPMGNPYTSMFLLMRLIKQGGR
jgi:hypothetical protein